MTMNKKQKESLISRLIQEDGLTRDQAIEYIMERRYHGCSHAEGLERAKSSPWAR